MISFKLFKLNIEFLYKIIKIKSQTFFNSLLGINYEKNDYFLEIYDMNNNNVKKKSINEIIF